MRLYYLGFSTCIHAMLLIDHQSREPDLRTSNVLRVKVWLELARLIDHHSVITSLTLQGLLIQYSMH